MIDAFIAEKITGTTLGVGDRAEYATGSIVSANYFDALGIHPILGRGFEAAEDSGRNAHPVTVISYQAWEDRFDGDPAIIGRTQLFPPGPARHAHGFRPPLVRMTLRADSWHSIQSSFMQ